MSARIGITYSNEIKVQPYADAVRAAGAEPVLISTDHAADLGELDGLLLSGGFDLNPALYGQERHPEADEPNDARDRLELGLLHQAMEKDLPVLAICRGMQLFNVEHGGTLQQHMTGHEAHRVHPEDRGEPAHEVTVEAGSKLAAIVGGSTAAVNSRHHQAVDRVGDGLVVSARAEDGTVEALERADKRFAVAVQWHPEDQAAGDAVQRRLFEEFVKAAG
jgi:putative glutamine amidotransferase